MSGLHGRDGDLWEACMPRKPYTLKLKEARAPREHGVDFLQLQRSSVKTAPSVGEGLHTVYLCTQTCIHSRVYLNVY